MAETMHEYVSEYNVTLQDRLDAEGVLLCVERGVPKEQLLEAVAAAGDPWTADRFDRAIELACNMPVFDLPLEHIPVSEITTPELILLEGGGEVLTDADDEALEIKPDVVVMLEEVDIEQGEPCDVSISDMPHTTAPKLETQVRVKETLKIGTPLSRPLAQYASTLVRPLGQDCNDIRENGLCAETDPEIFFPEKGGSTKEAKKVCLSCDIREECLAIAIEKDERFGIWGGLSERERRKYKKKLAQS